MVRIIGLIFVFGIASLCLAVTIHVTTSYAQPPDDCPCWKEGLAGLEQLLGSPNSIITDSFFVCDTGVHIQTSGIGGRSFYANIFVDDDHYVEVTVRHGENTGMCTRYGNNSKYKVSVFVDKDQAEACLENIYAYCTDYCMANPDSELCSQ